MSLFNRRKFLGVVGTGLLGISRLGNGRESAPAAAGILNETPAIKIKKYNALGKTGLTVSDISCGAIVLSNANVLKYAYDCGVNYFDTAEGYMNGMSETYLGQALKGIRDKVIITTKHVLELRPGWDKTTIIKRVEASLKRLQSDYVDIALIHGIADPQLLDHPEIIAAYAQLKKEGKVRFTGFSTHNAPLLLKKSLDSDFCQIALVIYNHMEGKAIEPLIEQAHKKGIGIIAMKVFAGNQQENIKGLINEKLSYPQAAIRWVLSNPHVACCIVSMASYNHIEEYVSTSGISLQRGDGRTISYYQKQANPVYCRVSCSQCLKVCPQKTAINDVLRYAMYFENYRLEKEAIRYYAELDEACKPLHCHLCKGPCVQACPYGLPVQERLLHSRDILTV